MNTRHALLLSSLALSVSLGCSAVKSSASDASGAAATWAAKGLLVDACQCNVFCPCEFASTPTKGRCDDTSIIHLERARVGTVALDGLDLVVVVQSPEGKRMIDTVGSSTFARIYVSTKVSDAEAEAAAVLARNLLGTFVKDKTRISADEKVERVELEVAVSSEKSSAKIPSILDLAVEVNHGGDNAAPITIHNSPWSAPGIDDVVVAHSTVYRYTAEGRNWDYGGQSASQRRFDMSAKLGS